MNILQSAHLATTSIMKTPLALSLLSAGAPAEVSDDYELLDINQIITGGREGIIAYRVSGDSMREEIRPGDYVFVDPQCEPKNGDTVVCRINNQNVIKIFQNGSAGLFLVPRNPEFVPLRPTPQDDVQILGVVLWHLGRDK
ncbi:MAG TPA: S24 family peptidase [Pyrinomonadaceae bacterium]|nr:S24 family peptidase [Pyrinomonadaceae bacterium]